MKVIPKPGFDAQLINWGAPDQTRTMQCSYCEAPLPPVDERQTLMLFTDEGWAAEFCEGCSSKCFGLSFFGNEPGDDDHAPNQDHR